MHKTIISGVQKATPGAPPSQFPTSDALPKLHGPVLLINGHEPDFMMAQSAATFDMIDHVPAFDGRPAQCRPHRNRV